MDLLEEEYVNAGKMRELVVGAPGFAAGWGRLFTYVPQFSAFNDEGTP